MQAQHCSYHWRHNLFLCLQQHPVADSPKMFFVLFKEIYTKITLVKVIFQMCIPANLPAVISIR